MTIIFTELKIKHHKERMYFFEHTNLSAIQSLFL